MKKIIYNRSLLNSILGIFILMTITGSLFLSCAAASTDSRQNYTDRPVPDGREVDVNYLYSPINVADITKATIANKTQVDDAAALSGATYHPTSGRWVVSADSLNTKGSQPVATAHHLYYLDDLADLADLSTIADTRKVAVDMAANNGINVSNQVVPSGTPGFPPDGVYLPYDMEGVTFLSSSEVLVINEIGNFLFFDISSSGDLSERADSRLTVPNLKPDHKFSSAAFDGTLVYTANKEGDKDIYVYNRDATPVANNPIRRLTLPSTITLKAGRTLDDYTISGMFYDNNKLFVMSEAFSTVFIVDPATAVISAVIGIEGIEEISGLAIKGGVMFLMGDTEDYIDTLYIYEVPILQNYTDRPVPDGREVDVDYRYGPINVADITKVDRTNRTQIDDATALSGATYHPTSGRWVVSADSLNTKGSQPVPTAHHLYYLDALADLADLSTIADTRKVAVDMAANNGINVSNQVVPPDTPGFPPDGVYLPYDMEGVTFLSSSEVLVINEIGNFLFFDISSSGALSERADSRLAVPNLKPDHKFSSAAFDGTLVYTANKEGDKDIYVYNRDATPVANNPIRRLTLPSTITLKAGRTLDDYTISGMFYDNNKLFVMSEAFSTVFIVDPATAVISAVMGIEGIEEISGLAIKDDVMFLMGDTEDYIDTLYIYEAPIPANLR